VPGASSPKLAVNDLPETPYPAGMNVRSRLLWSFALVLFATLATAQPAAVPAADTNKMPSVVVVPPEAQPSPNFNAEAATNGYLAQIPPAAKARSDAYFEGGYWLILWDLLYGALVALILLNFRWSAKMRDVAEGMTKFKPLQTAIYFVQYTLLTTVLLLPLTIYEGYFREHKYGLATQTFGPWAWDQTKGLLVNLLFGAIITTILFGIVRKLPRTWWVWGSLVTIAFLIFVILVVPVYVLPLFNKISRIDDPKITTPILSLARANGIPAHDVYTMDASKQTTRMSANVSGFANTMRITLNDNLLRRGSPEEIQAVMGHEMGHYVLNHVYKGIMEFGILIVVWFAALQWALGWALGKWGAKWQIRGIGDTAVLPLVLLVSSIFFFLLTPIENTLVRTQEAEADIFGVNASQQPDGFAQAAVHLGEYRKMSPGPVEEYIFYDHPSGRNRILMAMRWKGEHMGKTAGAP
jgi:STE24 endopeptidase